MRDVAAVLCCTAGVTECLGQLEISAKAREEMSAGGDASQVAAAVVGLARERMAERRPGAPIDNGTVVASIYR